MAQHSTIDVNTANTHNGLEITPKDLYIPAHAYTYTRVHMYVSRSLSSLFSSDLHIYSHLI